MKKRSIRRLAVIAVVLMLFNMVPLSVFAAEDGHWELTCAHGSACNTCDAWVPEVAAEDEEIDPDTGLVTKDAVEYAAAHCGHSHDAQAAGSMCWQWVVDPPEVDLLDACTEEGCQGGAACQVHAKDNAPGIVPMNLSAPVYYAVTFVDWDDTVLDTQQVLEGAGAFAPENPDRNGYAFTGWSGAFDNITADLTLKAQYKPIEYNISYQLGGGTNHPSNPATYTIESANITLADPTRPGFTFAGWQPGNTIPSGSTGDKTFVSTWTQPSDFQGNGKPRTLTYIYGDYTFIIRSSGSGKGMEFTMTIIKDGVTQVDNAQAEKKNMNPGTGSVELSVPGYGAIVLLHGNAMTGGVDISGTETPRTVIWKNDDGTVLETDVNVPQGSTPVYNGQTPAKTATAQYTYTFSGWSPALSPVTSDITYTATYAKTPRTYTVTWANEGGAALETDRNVPYRAMPSYDGATPTKLATAASTFMFAGWTPSISPVTSDRTYTATFTESPRSYTVIWKNEGGAALETDTNVPYNTMPQYNGTTPTKLATAASTFTFAGWSPTIASVTSDRTYTATFTETPRTYTVTWTNEGGAVLETDRNVPYNTMPQYNGATPTRPATVEFTYAFAGWTPTIAPVTSDRTYTATFTETINTYTVTWVNDDGAVLETDLNVPYNTMPQYDGATPTKQATADYTYTFAGWSQPIAPVTGDITYEATFTATAIPAVVVLRLQDPPNPVPPNPVPVDVGTPLERLEPEAVPLAAPTPVEPAALTPGEPATPFALLNLMLAVLALGLSAYLLASISKRRKAGQTRARMENGKPAAGTVWRILGLLMGIASPLAFLLTANLRGPMVFVDLWTPLMAALGAVQIAAILLTGYVRGSSRHNRANA